MAGDNSTWAILVHGKGANRREALRMMPVLHREGMHCLAITYRNDVDCPPDPDGFYAYGRTEWEELEAAAAYALAHGAERLVIVGYSMGGAITMSFMARSKLARHVAALILDAPMLHLEETIAWGATQLRVPAGHSPSAIASFRSATGCAGAKSITRPAPPTSMSPSCSSTAMPIR